MAEVTDLLAGLDGELPASDQLVVPSRTVRLPLSWDDPATHEAIQRYMHGVRADAPWCPWNIEFIRRINGLDDVAQVHDIVFDAQYLVLGLGDVYLGAPVATPLDPRHRLVTTKYNPARTWTPENAVGIGGAYLCIYGMEGPGGYQFVGRTTQVWNHCHPGNAQSFEPGTPWLLRYFDRISFYPVSAEELMHLRAEMAAGRGEVAIDDGKFSLADYRGFLTDNDDEHHRVPSAAGRRVRGGTPGVGPGRGVSPGVLMPVHLGVALCPPLINHLGRHRRDTSCTMAKSSDQANSRYLEVERKFEVFESTVRPSFEGLSSVARVERSPSQQLDAVYFDTPAHDLAAHRVTLRRRTGGTDAGWHLKLPAGPDARTEVRAPLGDETGDTVPEELLDVVLAIVRDRPVGPVARISTSRTVDMLYGPDGAAVAEFCDDDVVARAEGDEESEQRWREWELELAEGADPRPAGPADEPAAGRGRGAGRPRFEARARPRRRPDADDPDAVEPPRRPGAPRGGRAGASSCWCGIARCGPTSYDSVHQMRVTTRKIRSLLQASEGAFGISDDAWILDELRQLAAVLGVARDAEVLAERYEKALDELPDGTGPRAGAGAAGRRRQAALHSPGCGGR